MMACRFTARRASLPAPRALVSGRKSARWPAGSRPWPAYGGPKILHAHSPALGGLAALRAGRRLSIPVVYEIRAFWEDAAVGNGTGREGSLRYRLTRALEDRVVKGADAVITICQGLRSDLIARGNAAERITIMPNGVDLALFGQPLPRDAAFARKLRGWV